ncbi:MAG: hypothetical protein KIT34_14790 [Cyanobacteria bacterium TGS_CYA1]|nr:hypothetical protein [Cyanobacteria bacterium TGS_CYA1]
MKSFKVKLALCAVGILVFLAVGIFVFIKLSMVNVPVTTFTRKDVQKLPINFVQISRLFKWNQKVLIGIGPYNEFKLFVLEPNNRLEPFHRISPDITLRYAYTDKQNRLVVCGVRNGSVCIDVLTSENKFEVEKPLSRQFSGNSYTGLVQSSQVDIQFLDSTVTSEKRLFWLNESEGKLYCWDISGDLPKELPYLFLPKIAKLEIPSGLNGCSTNFWRIQSSVDNVATLYDCLGNLRKLDLETFQVSKVTPLASSQDIILPSPLMRCSFKDKLGRNWEIRDLQNRNNGEISCEVICLEGKKVVHRSMVRGARDGQQPNGSNFVESIFGAFHFHNLKESVNWNYPPTSFTSIFEDKLGNIYLRTDDEGFFKLVNNKWERYSSPNLNCFGPTLMDENQIVLASDQGQILRYHLTENTCESLELTTDSNSDTYNRGPGLVGYPVRSLRMETVRRDHPQQVYPRYPY